MAKKRAKRSRSRRRRGSTSIHHVKQGLLNSKLWNTLAGGAGVLAFYNQATSTDRAYADAHGLLNNFTTTQKIEQGINWIVSRVTFGMVNQPFADVYPGNKPTFQVGNIINKYTGAGLAAWLYSKFAYGLPMRGLVGKFKIPLLLGGVIGGLFDDPVSGAMRVNPSGLNVPTVAAFSGAVTGGGGAGVGAITRSVSGVNALTSNLNQR